MKKRKNRSVAYIAVFVGLIMVLSVVGFLWSGESSNSYKYNGFGFSYSDGKWSIRTADKMLYFDYLPEDLENISVPQEARNLLSSARLVYLTSSNNLSEETALAKYDLMVGLETENRYVVNSVLEENVNNIPVISCKNATAFSPVIIINESDKDDSIILNNNCIKLEGTSDIVSERLLYSAYGIMD